MKVTQIHVLGIVAVLCVALGVSACGSSQSSQSKEVSSSANQAHVGATPNPTRQAASLTEIGSFTGTPDASGYTYSGSISAGSIRRYQDNLMTGNIGSTALGSTDCTLSSSTDAMFPVQIKLTNTTHGFSYDVSGNFQFNSSTPPKPLNVGEYRVYYVSEGHCDAIWARPTCSQLAPGASCLTSLYVVLKNYYDPAHPDGNTPLGVGDIFYLPDQTQPICPGVNPNYSSAYATCAWGYPKNSRA